MEIVLTAISLCGLWLGTRWVISAAFGIAERYNLSHSFVGLAILSICTDLPEVFVTVNASIQNLKGNESSGIITGNAIGSCISQVTVILGIAALFTHLKMNRFSVFRDGSFLILSIIILFGCGLDGMISRTDAIILFITYLAYFIFLFKTKHRDEPESVPGKKYSIGAIIAFFVFGFPLLIFSSHLLIDNVKKLAEGWGVAQSFIAMLIIGVGTSLPELAVSVGAALKKSSGMSLGNIVGSNIFDTVVPVAIGGAIKPLQFERNMLLFDLPFLLTVTLSLVFFLIVRKRVATAEAIILICAYILFLILKIAFFKT